ncbi:hypothetical protein BH11BAC5_BH11BAC5_20640 [soil metagenome]
MRQTIFFISSFLFVISVSCSNKEPFKPPYDNIGGYVIGSETCNSDTTQNYWLLDFTVYSDSPHIGDTLILNGTAYTNVLKVKGLDAKLKQFGMRVSIDYNVVSPNKVITKGCTVSTPITYNLKEISIINQFEIR